MMKSSVWGDCHVLVGNLHVQCGSNMELDHNFCMLVISMPDAMGLISWSGVKEFAANRSLDFSTLVRYCVVVRSGRSCFLGLRVV